MHQPDESEGMSGFYFDLADVPDEYIEDCSRVNAMTAQVFELGELMHEMRDRFLETGEGRLRLIRISDEVIRLVDETKRAYSELQHRLARDLRAGNKLSD